MRSIIIVLLLSVAAFAQGVAGDPGTGDFQLSGGTPITLDASCTGNGTANDLQCSSAMTVTAGDTIGCKVTGVSGGNRLTGTVMDAQNGFYDNVYGLVTPASVDGWETVSFLYNSAGGSITPILIFSNTPSTRATINCKAWKGVPTTNVLDSGAVEQTTSATVTNPTSGTAAAPSNANELVWAVMSRSSSTAPSSGGSPWLPAGTLTLVGSSSVRQADEYQVQTSATAVNGPFTGNGTSIATVDSQIALLPLGTTGGTRALTGFFVPLGAPGSAPTGSVSAALLGAAGSTLASTNFSPASPFWSFSGTAPTYDTTINPTGTKSIMVQQVAHTFGDAGASIVFAGSSTSSFFTVTDIWDNIGTPQFLDAFYRLASAGATNSTVCDVLSQSGGITDQQIILQIKYASSGNYTVVLEPAESGSSQATSNLSADTDYWFQLHIAGVNERYHQLLVYTKSGATWSLSQTLNYDHLCTNGNHANCGIPTAQASTTGTASSGSTALTVASGTGILVGQVVIGTGIPDPSQTGHPAWTTVAAVSGTSVTLSQNTSASLSGTSVSFYTAPANLNNATNCSVTAGSTSMTCVTPGTGTITAGQSVGGSGIAQGTQVASVSLPTVTLTVPTQSTMASGSGVSFWNADTNGNVVSFGKDAGGSCNVTSNMWWSGVLEDTFGTWGAFAPN